MIDTEVTNYESYLSKDGKYEYSICYVDGLWDVDCWTSFGGDSSQHNDNHWHKSFRKEELARAEFNRWRNM